MSVPNIEYRLCLQCLTCAGGFLGLARLLLLLWFNFTRIYIILVQLFCASSHLWCISGLWSMAFGFWPRQSVRRDFTIRKPKTEGLVSPINNYYWPELEKMMKSLVWEALAFSAPAHSRDLINCRVKLISFQLCSRIISSSHPLPKIVGTPKPAE